MGGDLNACQRWSSALKLPARINSPRNNNHENHTIYPNRHYLMPRASKPSPSKSITMKRPFRESNQSDDIDADYMEFMRRMYDQQDQKPHGGMARILFLSVGIVACIATLIYQLS